MSGEGGMHREAKNRLTAALVGLLLALTTALWGLISPVGSSADEGFHLTSIWCAWGEHENCRILDSESGERTILVPAAINSSAPCFVTEQGGGGDRSAACVKTVSDELAPSTGNLGSYPPLYYASTRMFVGPDTEFSVVAIRVFNAVLAGALLAFALLVVNRPIRTALALSWAVGLVPLGLFFMGSVNPSSWAIIGVGTYWAFLLNWLSSPTLKSRTAWLSLVGVVLSGLMAAGARSDAGFYIGVSTLVAALLAVPSAHFSPRRLLILVVPLFISLVSLTFRLGGPQGLVSTPLSATTQSRTSAIEYGLLGQIIRYALETPAALSGAFGANQPGFNQAYAFYWGVGWFDVYQPTIVLVAVLTAIGGVLFWGFATYSRSKIAAVALVSVVLIATPLLIIAPSGFTTSIFTARYALPLLLLFIAVVAYRPVISGKVMSKAQAAVILAAMGIAQSAALLATIRRYTNGQEDTWLSFGFEPEWWWTGAPHPTFAWLLGTFTFLTFALLALQLAAVESESRIRGRGAASTLRGC